VREQVARCAEAERRRVVDDDGGLDGAPPDHEAAGDARERAPRPLGRDQSSSSEQMKRPGRDLHETNEHEVDAVLGGHRAARVPHASADAGEVPEPAEDEADAGDAERSGHSSFTIRRTSRSKLAGCLLRPELLPVVAELPRERVEGGIGELGMPTLHLTSDRVRG
jgi:hypothetical protein